MLREAFPTKESDECRAFMSMSFVVKAKRKEAVRCTDCAGRDG